MKKAISIIVLVVLVLTSFAGCSTPNKKSEAQLKEEIKKELQAEMAAEQKKDVDKKADTQQEKPKESKGVHDLDSVFEFVASKYQEYSREDFNKWSPNFLDLNSNGSDEVVFTTTYYDGKLESAIVIMVEEGQFKEIPSYIPLAKYENNISFEDGFLVNKTKAGGSGAFYYNMDLYVYDGDRIVDAVDGDIKIEEDVSAPDTNYSIASEINGSLKDFVITLTKSDNRPEKEEVISKDRYIYDSEGMFFWRKPISLSNTAKSFDKVYNGSNLKETIKYFYDNLYHFSESAMKDYSIKMIKVIEKDGDKIYSMNDYISDEAYDFDTNELDLSKLNENVKESINFIKKSGVYKLVKLFYANEGGIDDYGFAVFIDSWPFEMLKPALDFAYPDRYTPYNYKDLEPFIAPNIYLYSVKQVENTAIVYPNVLVQSYEDVKKLEGAKTWKTQVVMPVNIVGN